MEDKYNKNQICLEEIEVRYDKNQDYQEKLNKVITKIEVVKKKIEDSYHKYHGYLERNWV